MKYKDFCSLVKSNENSIEDVIGTSSYFPNPIQYPFHRDKGCTYVTECGLEVHVEFLTQNHVNEGDALPIRKKKDCVVSVESESEGLLFTVKDRTVRRILIDHSVEVYTRKMVDFW